MAIMLMCETLPLILILHFYQFFSHTCETLVGKVLQKNRWQIHKEKLKSI